MTNNNQFRTWLRKSFALTRITSRKLGEHRRADSRLVEAPRRTNEIVRRRFAADPIDDHRRRQQLDKIDERAHVLAALHQPHFAAATWSASGVFFTQ